MGKVIAKTKAKILVFTGPLFRHSQAADAPFTSTPAHFSSNVRVAA